MITKINRNTLIYCLIHIMFYPCLAKADLITSLTVEQSSVPGGAILYAYTLENFDISDYSVGVFNLAISPDADLTMLSAPVGWRNLPYEPGQGAIAWEATDEAFFIQPSSTAVFSFVSPLNPDLMNYVLFGYSDDPSDFARDDGIIAAPSVAAIPEPTSMIPFGTGLAGLVGYAWHRRWRSAR